MATNMTNALSVEETNHLRAVYLCCSVAPEAVRACFDRQHPQLGRDLTIAKSDLQKIKTKKILKQFQWDQLYQSIGSPSPVSTDFDITLLICLLRNMKPVISPPPLGFDALPKSSHTSDGAHIARIKYYRNQLAHSTDGKLSNTKFTDLWKDLEVAIIGLSGSQFTWFSQKINNAKTISLDSTLAEILRQLTEYEKRHEELSVNVTKLNDLNTAIENLSSGQTDIKEDYERKLVDVNQDIQEQEHNMMEMSKTVKLLEIQMSKLSSDLQEVKSDVAENKRDLQEVKSDVAENKRDITAEIQNIEKEMASVSRNTEEVRLKVKEMETKMSAAIPANIQDQIKVHLELWQKEDNMFVSTRASKHVLECITENSCVTITGNPGVGKTFIVRHVALIMKGQGYTVVPTCKPTDIRKFTRPGSKTLFVVDDICGHYTLNQKYLDDWKQMLSYIYNTLSVENHCKIIATCRLQVFKDEKFKDLSIFTSNECYLNSEKLCLTSDEKTSLAEKYFDDQLSQMSDQYEFFPLLCSLYDKDKFSDLSLFFSKPFDCYKQDLEQLLKEGDESRYKYCVLALVVMFNNKLSENHLSGGKSEIIKNTLDQCKLNIGTSGECLKDALHTLEGTFIVKDDDCYKIIHAKLFDFLANYFGDKMLKCIINNATSEFVNERILWNTPDNTETAIDFTIYLLDNCLDMYISRLVNDWSDGKVYSLFSSRNLKSPTFTVKLLDHIKQHDKSFQVKLANVTVDNKYHDTTLMASCFVGDANLTQWIIDNTVYNGRWRVLFKPVTFFNKLSQWFYSDSIVNKCRNDGTSSVHIACYNGHLSVLNRLIECKADINKCMNNGASPVYIACYYGHVDILNTLLESKADVNKCSKGGYSPLHIACYCNHIDVVLVLLKLYKKNKVMIDLSDDWGNTPLHVACNKGFVQMVTLLLQHGANPHQCDNGGISPLKVADDNGHVDVVTAIKEFNQILFSL